MRTTSAILFSLALCASAAADQPDLIIAVGAGGNDAYAETFAGWAETWRKAGQSGGFRIEGIGLAAGEKDSAARLVKVLTDADKASVEPLWLVLLGHGTWNGKDAKFNLRGEDITADSLAALLKPFERPVVVVCGFSASGAFLAPLSAPGRVVVTATRAGGEVNYSRFAGFLGEAIADRAGDLDKDGQTSLLEAFVAASRKTADFYKEEGRLATEHSLLDDNGDGAGTPGDWFRGVRAVKKPSGKADADGARANQLFLVRSKDERELSADARGMRDELESKVEQLRGRKPQMKEDEYLAELEKLVLQLAALYRDAGKPAPKPESSPRPERP